MGEEDQGCAVEGQPSLSREHGPGFLWPGCEKQLIFSILSACFYPYFRARPVLLIAGGER
jgi:hypothetical protein